MTTPTPDREALLALADKKDAKARRKYAKDFLCPKGWKRIKRLRDEADLLRARHARQARALAGDRP